MKLAVLTAVSVIAFSVAVAPAQAAIVTATYTGHVTEGFDHTGLFGQALTSLNGDIYKAVFRYDTSLGAYSQSPSYSSLNNGSTLPLLSAVVTINGASLTINGSASTGIYGKNYGGVPYGPYSLQYHSASDYSDDGQFQTMASTVNDIHNLNTTLISSIATPFTYHVAPGDYAIAYLTDFKLNYLNSHYLYNASATIALDTLVVTTGVPEPSTWALMLAGFAGLGFAGYRRNRRAMA